MNQKSITYVAMDTHKKQHRVAILATETGETIEMTIANTAKEITKMVKKIKKLSDSPIRICYEAGVCGFALKRKLESLGCQCAVIAPSLIPRKHGERIKTDRRDALKLLDFFMKDLLTEVFAPNEQQESARDLTRLRETAQENLKRVRHQLIKLLLRHGYIYHEGRHWTNKHFTWLRSLDLGNSLLNNIFENYYTELQHCQTRLETLDKELELLANTEPYREPVAKLRCFHGIDTLTAISIITEIFNFGRFESPRLLMAYLGLTPSEDSSGDKQTKGSITKTGNKRVRRLLNEAAWHYRYRFNPGAQLKKRRQNQPQWAINIADQAGQRLTKRYRYLINKGKMPCKANIAVARELIGFIWALLKENEIQKQDAA